MCWQLTKDVLDSLSSIATVAGVGAAVYYGRRGLDTWRSQIKGAADNELARRILVLLYRYKAAMERLRSLVTTSFDFAPRAGEEPDPDFETERFNQMCRGFDRRRQALNDVRSELDAALLECRAVWGESMVKMFHAIDSLEHEWYMCFVLHIRISNPRTNKADKLKWQEAGGKSRDVLYDSGDVDEFRHEFESFLLEMEKYLKSKLVR